MPTDTTPKLNLPLIAAQQAQKHVTHNEALHDLDTLVQATVKDRDLTAPPATPAKGDAYIVAAAATGDWAGHEGEIAEFRNGGWVFHAPLEGWRVWVADEDVLLAYDGAAWQPALDAIRSLNPADGGKVGVNTTADDTNRLAVKSDAVLFSHDDVTPGAGDMRVKVNKKTAADTASFLFQDNFSGRAEFGLTGDDDFHVKVSADGSSWKEALKIDTATGGVQVPASGFGAGPVITTDYSNAKGVDMTVNGTGLLGGYNWPPALAVDRAETPALPAAFSYTGYYDGNVHFSSEYLAVDPHRIYEFSILVRQSVAAHRQYVSLAFYDADKKLIRTAHTTRWHDPTTGNDSLTTLSQPLKPGDTQVHLNDASAWNNSGSTPRWRRGLIIFGYKNSFGHLYDYYSRYQSGGMWDPGAVDTATNTVTLNAPLPNWMGNPDDPQGAWPAGTRIANTDDAYGIYKYVLMYGDTVPSLDTWYRFTTWIGGIDTSGLNARNNFPPGTAYVRFLFIMNYSNRAGGWSGYPDTPAATVWFAGLSLRPAPLGRLVPAADGSQDVRVARLDASGGNLEYLTAGGPIVEAV